MALTERLLQPRSDNALEHLKRADRLWQAFRSGKPPVPEVVRESKELLITIDFDAVICGGTLGILIGAALQKRGQKVALIERGKLKGREQEWNISRQELEAFVALELLTSAELETAIATEYNPARVSFFQGYELWVKDVLNIGVDPVFLLETLKHKFTEAGGQLLEYMPFKRATVYRNGIQVEAGDVQITTRLLIDAMGHFSPIVSQARAGEKPEGVCLVVGSCAQGYSQNESGDLLVSTTPILNQCQYFWEAFPARDGRTTYLFTYLDAHPERPSLQFFLEEYLRLLPDYQKVDLEQLQFERFLFGFFPSYQKSPLRTPWNRILPVGDSSSSQSPVSFGGFGATVRHLSRLCNGINEALAVDALNREALALLQPYQPNISVTWLFQRTMSVGVKQNVPPNQINDLMSSVFAVMDRLGDNVLKPFLQDVIQFSALSRTLPQVDPKIVLPILPQVGISPLIDWSLHYFNLALYSGLYSLGKQVLPLANRLPPLPQYYYHRALDAWQYGSGGDYFDREVGGSRKPFLFPTSSRCVLHGEETSPLRTVSLFPTLFPAMNFLWQQNFSQAIDVPDEHIDLARAALCFAQAEYPHLVPDEYLNALDTMADEVKERLPEASYPLRVIKSINQYLFDDLGFRGNADSYYDCRNSYLNEVIDRRTGIPITLSAIYLEIAKRLDFPMVGIGMPGHFLIRPDFAEAEIFVDPFNQGEILFAQDCQARLTQIYQQPVQLQPQFLSPISNRQILTRMLTNLKLIYIDRQEIDKALTAVELILLVFPDNPAQIRDRGLLYYQLNQWQKAAQDLEFYLIMLPQAADAESVRQILKIIR